MGKVETDHSGSSGSTRVILEHIEQDCVNPCWLLLITVPISYLLFPVWHLQEQQLSQDETCFCLSSAPFATCSWPINNQPHAFNYVLLWLHKLLHAPVFPSQYYFIPEPPSLILHPHHYKNQNPNLPFYILMPKTCMQQLALTHATPTSVPETSCSLPHK